MKISQDAQSVLKSLQNKWRAQTPRDRDLGLSLLEIANETVGEAKAPAALEELWQMKYVTYQTLGGGFGHLLKLA